MLSHPHSLPDQFLASHGNMLLFVAIAWALFITFVLANGWRRRRHLLAQVLDMGITAIMVGLMMYLPFLALALGARLGWF